MKILSNDKISTGLGDRLFSSYNILQLKPKIFRTLSSGIKVIDSFCLDISMILPRVENLGFIVSGYLSVSKCFSGRFLLLI